MSNIFFPSCKVTKRFPGPSTRLRTWLEANYEAEVTGCCKINHKNTTPEDTAVVICNNCGAIVEESGNAGTPTFVWEWIDACEDFPFPDYHGERMALQDCWRAYDRRGVQDAIRSILRKMNIDIEELPENYGKTKFCGADLMEPCTDVEKRFAPRRYDIEGGHMYKPMTPYEQDAALRDHCSSIESEKVICYCLACYDGLRRGGKTPIHLIELLFNEDQ